ncbi:MAG: bifunctional precorrin-2 dehydrogenase/sirohydrochlorin ferrochelatase [Dehalococcoidia bacterium]|nr:bifunctional precorrin-2 dehydrogenase/sirohydrochlorin ferrochelatase [Dehalococcoidia bacterium]
MSYCPIMVDIKGKRCVLIGGGGVALRRAEVLVEYGARVEIISPELCPEINRLVASSAVLSTLHEYKPGDLCGSFVVVAATDNSKINDQVAEEALKLGILINVVDIPEFSSFIVPSCLHRGDVTIAVSTGGKSPALARRLRTELEKSFGDEYASLALLVSQVRSELKQEGITIPAEVWQQALDLDMLLELLRLGQWDEAKQRLLSIFGRHE